MSTLFRITPSGAAGLAFALFALVAVPSIAGSQWLNIFISTACFALAVAGVAFMYARLGMVSLTQVGLMGIGGWVLLRLNHALDLPFEVNLAAAGAVTMVLGMVLALPALRLRGLYLALVTLMAAGGIEIILATFQFPNGGDGFWGVQTGSGEGFRRPAIAQSDAAYLRYTLFVVVLGFLLIELHRRLAPGRAWALIRRSEAAAMSAGVNVTLYKTWAFALSGLLAGIAGGLLAGSLGLLDGGTFRASESVLVYALAVVGGAGYWLGAVIAAALFRILPALLNNWGLDADLSFVIFGAGLLHAVVTAPNGIAGQAMDLAAAGRDRLTRLATRLGGRRRRGADARGGLDAPVEIADLTVRFGGVLALDRVAATFTRPVNGIIGPNGAGKTTLMNVFSGFVNTESGSIRAGTEDLMRLPAYRRGLWGLRRSFQKEEIADDLSVAENVAVQIDGSDLPRHDRRAEVDRALAIVGLTAEADMPAVALNSYQRRLVDVAKCIVGRPRIIMFDEPAGGLSGDETRALGDLILQLHRHTGAMTLVIDHDVDLISRICDETLVLDFGKRIAFGPTAEVLADPKVRAAYLGVEEV